MNSYAGGTRTVSSSETRFTPIGSLHSMVPMRGVMALALCAAIACGSGRDGTTSAARARTPGIRITMDELHRLGGVPTGWRLTPPPGDVAAGRQAFVDLGCHSCHRVAGEQFSAKETPGQVGPELTGMGAHHPPAYFAEAIMSPDAVLIEGPGYIGPDGHSVMPDYPELTLAQLGDLVAYLSSLRTGDPHAGHVMGTPPILPANLEPHAAPPPHPGQAFIAQSYEILPGRLAAFERWFADGGAERLLALDGVVAVDTYADFTHAEKPYTTVVSFRDAAAMQRFQSDRAAETVGGEFDAFVGSHTHLFTTALPVYRVPSLSAP